MNTKNMLVERAREVAFKQFVVEYGLGYHTSNKFEVAEMVGVTVRCRVDCVCDPVSW